MIVSGEGCPCPFLAPWGFFHLSPLAPLKRGNDRDVWFNFRNCYFCSCMNALKIEISLWILQTLTEIRHIPSWISFHWGKGTHTWNHIVAEWWKTATKKKIFLSCKHVCSISVVFSLQINVSILEYLFGRQIMVLSMISSAVYCLEMHSSQYQWCCLLHFPCVWVLVKSQCRNLTDISQNHTIVYTLWRWCLEVAT